MTSTDVNTPLRKTDSPVSMPSLAGGLGEGFFQRARTDPNRAALEVQGETLTYRMLAERAGRIAEALRLADGETSSQLTGVLASRSATAFAAVLGVLRRGHGYVPINPAFPSARNRAIVDRSGCSAIVVAAEGMDLVDGILAGVDQELVIVLADELDPSPFAERWAPHRVVVPHQEPMGDIDFPSVSGADPAYLLFTSGSTGVPKGVVVSHANARAFMAAAGARYSIGPEDRLTQMFDFTFDLSVFDMFLAWENGACVCCPSAQTLLKPSDFVRRSELTVWFSVPSVAVMMQRLRLLKPGAFPSLRLSLFCGEALPADVARAWALAAPSSRVENLYGPTEATIACTAYSLGAPGDPEEELGLVPIGYPIGGMSTRVVVPGATTEVETGGEGELLLHGPQVVSGYWNDPEATARSFVRIGDDVFYRTGDRVRRSSADGPLKYLGRLDDQIKVLGYRVELGEIEAALRDEAQSPAAAVGWPRTASGAAGIVAFVADLELDTEALRSRLARRLPEYMVPREVRVVPELPLNANGKCDRKALIAILES